jgi:mRNA interferase RelE/StbE
MTSKYELKFIPKALKEWEKLGQTLKNEFKKALEKRLINPRIPKHKIAGKPDAYKIKLKTAGYRLVYQVIDQKLIVLVLVIGKREKNEVYNQLNALPDAD